MPSDSKSPLPPPFSSYLAEDFARHCEAAGAEAPNTALAHFLLDSGLVSKPGIQQYVLQKALASLVPQVAINKTHAVAILARRFHLSERTVWKLLRGAGGGEGNKVRDNFLEKPI